MKTFALDSFSHCQFDDPKHQGTRIDWDKSDFETAINQLYEEGHYELIDGYAPFCKHLFIPNFVNAKLSTAEITETNAKLLKTDYDARTSTELSVLVRWFPADQIQPQVAKYLDVILYSREQIKLEEIATGRKPSNETTPWGIIYVKAQDSNYELPMDPITIMRNALGKEEGGSGVPLNPAAYKKSVEYWSKIATIQ